MGRLEDGTPFQKISLEGISYMCDVCGLAQRLLLTVLDHKPIGEIVQELCIALYGVEMNTCGAATIERLSDWGSELSETDWVSVELEGKYLTLRGKAE